MKTKKTILFLLLFFLISTKLYSQNTIFPRLDYKYEPDALITTITFNFKNYSQDSVFIVIYTKLKNSLPIPITFTRRNPKIKLKNLGNSIVVMNKKDSTQKDTINLYNHIKGKRGPTKAKPEGKKSPTKQND